MKIHAAITVFDSFQKDSTSVEYHEQLAHWRMKSFLSQKNLEELSVVITTESDMSKGLRNILQPFLRASHNKINIKVYLMKLKDPKMRSFKSNGPQKDILFPSGLLTSLISNNSDWIFFSDDGHVIPTTVESLDNALRYSLDKNPEAEVVGFSEREFIGENSVFLRYHELSDYDKNHPIFKEHKIVFQDQDIISSCYEYGHYQRHDTLRNCWYPTRGCHKFDPLLFNLQGLKVSLNNGSITNLCHHWIRPGVNNLFRYIAKESFNSLMLPDMTPNTFLIESLKRENVNKFNHFELIEEITKI